MPLLPLVLFSLLAAPAQTADAPPDATYTVTCTFTNPTYAGPCGVDEEVPARLSPRAACRRILGCLNNPTCTKSYCNATTIRGGWNLVRAARKSR